VDEDFLAHFLKGGVANYLTQVAKGARYPVDLQMRKNPKTEAQWATLYTGLTAVLNVHRTRDGFRLSGHKTWSQNPRFGFNPDWVQSASEAVWRQRWREVELYLERVIPVATKSHGLTEGAVQAAVSGSRGRSIFMLDREVTPSFRDRPLKTKILTGLSRGIVDALPRDLGAGRVPGHFGSECDLLGIDETGRLLAIEVKPYTGGSIAWVAAQATMYARILTEWVRSDGQARNHLDRMVEQRAQLLGQNQGVHRSAESLTVVPVVALQRGASDKALQRMLDVRDCLGKTDLGVPPTEVLQVSITGDLEPLR
jgi:hypothetical protein